MSTEDHHKDGIKFSVWLIPSESHHAALDGVIKQLGTEHEAPLFEPHVTVYAGEAHGEAELHQFLPRIAHGIKPFSLDVEGIQHTDQFFKTIFISLASNEAITSLSDRSREPLRHKVPYELHPHLSLIYRSFSPEQRARISDSIQLPFRQITFDTLRVITARSKEQGWYDLSQWKVEESLGLGTV